MTLYEISVVQHNDTGLMEIRSSGGNLALSQIELAMVYLILRKSLGIRGRFRLWRMKRQLLSNISSTIAD